MVDEIKISIPLDEDGFMLMQCPSCGAYFKVRSDDFEAEDVLELWCPLCGLKHDSYWPSEVLELAKAKVMNQVFDAFDMEMRKVGKSLSRQPFIKMTVTSNLLHKRECEILPAVDAYELTTCSFCGRSEKIRPLPKYVGAFCSFCGERI